MTDHRHGESCDVLADNVVTPQEADALRRWLGAAGWLKKFWPANVLSQRINQLLDAPDKKELNDLRDALRRIVECGVFDDLPDTVEIFDDPAPAIVFAERTFCLTGVFYFGSRLKCEQAVTERGGIIRRTVSGSTNYVIVGGICNP